MAVSVSIIVLLLIFIIVLPLLQIFLSRLDSRIPGLILPVISFIISLLYVFNMYGPLDGAGFMFIFSVIMVFLITNIPTAVFLVIYFVCREKRRKRKQIDKMNIHDLD
ncbi:MAG: hypothetical protein PUD43_05295 [Clostridia bacterium]|nr:hypothetical protein [Clostridia bacterium]